GHLPRSLVPGPHCHAYPRLRGRQPRGMVRGQLSGIRGGPETPPGRRGGSPAPPALQAARGLTVKRTSTPRPDGEYITSLARGLSVLRAFTRDHPEMSLSEVAAL